MNRDSCARWVALSDREICGEPLSEGDHKWRREHARRCLACAAESQFYAKLDGVLTHPDYLDTAVASIRPVRPSTKWVSLWTFAAAATITLGGFGYSHVTARSGAKRAAATTTQPVSARLVAAYGQVKVAQQPPRIGQFLLTDHHVTTETGSACVSTTTRVTSCLDARSDARFTVDDARELRVELTQGKLLSQLEKQPENRPFTVQTPAGRITAKGTTFSVTVEDVSHVTVVLHEGRLWLETPTKASAILEAPASATLNGTITTHPLEVAAIDRDRALLERTRLSFSSRDGATATRLEVTTEPEAATVTLDGTVLGPTPLSAFPSEPITPTSKPTPITAVELLERAQQARAQGKYSLCAGLYRQLLATHPGSNEARVSMVSLGELELQKLGHPALALRAFEQYLTVGGSLIREARYGRIEALERLGRGAEALTHAQAFVSDYPKSIQADTLRRKFDVR